VPQSQLTRSFVATVWSAFGVKGSRLRIRLILVLGLLFGVALFQISNLALALPTTTASRVYGQLDNFNTGGSNLQFPSSISLNTYPNGVAVDPAGGIYVADTFNNRVLHYPAGSTTADRVYGQLGSFNSNTANKGGISPDSLYRPAALVVDAGGGLFVVDNNNHRVLHYPTGSTTADRVYGQLGSFTTNAINKGGLSADSLYYPSAVAVDSSAGLYVVDDGNQRVLHYSASSTTADGVYGQFGSFTTGTVNNGGVSADSLANPEGVAVDPAGGIYVADTFNSRVLHFSAGSTTADRVYGQLGDFTTGTNNKGGRSANSLYFPLGVGTDSSGGLYVTDSSNNRVLYYPASGSTTADRVYGQLGNFTTDSSNINGISADGFYFPVGVAADSSGSLYIVDTDNNRVLHYPVGSTTADRVYGQVNSFTTNTSNNNGGRTASSLDDPLGVVIDSGGGLYAVDNNNHRVLHYPAGSTTADRVYGQLGSFITGMANKGGVSADSFYYPTVVTVDAIGGLYVTDSSNSRILHYSANSTTADRVYGQLGSFSTGAPNKGGLSADSLADPVGLAIDSSGGLYVADQLNNRVLHYPAGSTTADRVYGQLGSFTTNTANKGGSSANSLSGPVGVAVDLLGNLYVADSTNHRVLRYPVSGSTTADRVYGQLGSFGTSLANNGGRSANSLYWPKGVAIDRVGGLYVADQSNQRVLHYPVGSTTADKVYGQHGNFTTGVPNIGGLNAVSLSDPFGVAVDLTGNLYIADSTNNRVLYYADVTTPTTITLESNSNPSIFGQSVTFTATVSPISASGTVTFTEGAATLGTGTLANGIVTFSTSSLSVGSHDISATYGGDNSYIGSSSNTIHQVVNQASTSLTLTSLPNPSTFGQSVSFTATISPLMASGTVTFTESGSILGTGTLSAGVATFSITNLPIGSHVISATYGGDSSYAGSVSNTVEQVVNSDCEPLVVNSNTDNGAGTICGTFSYALMQVSPGMTITFAFTQSNTITFTGALTPTVKSGVTIDGGSGVGGIVLYGNGVGRGWFAANGPGYSD
jgi:sugar lactone lactonase YvrE